MTVHAIHEQRGIVAYDNCDRCDEYTLLDLDTHSLAALSDLAAARSAGKLSVEDQRNLSGNDYRLMSRMDEWRIITHRIEQAQYSERKRHG